MTADPAASNDTEIARIHLDMLGELRVFPVFIRLGRCSLLDLLPPARELTEQAAAVAVARARDRGEQISCRAGCGACCRQLVAVPVVEALALAELVATLPPAPQERVRARFRDAVHRLESVGLLDPEAPKGQRVLTIEVAGERRAVVDALARRYFVEQIPCPFLEEESCTIHPDRPVVCREYHVTSPAAACADLYGGEVVSVQPPLHVGDALARVAARVAGTPPSTIPLVLALEWAEANGERLRAPCDGMAMFRAFVEEIDRDYVKPFGTRAGGGRSD